MAGITIDKKTGLRRVQFFVGDKRRQIYLPSIKDRSRGWRDCALSESAAIAVHIGALAAARDQQTAPPKATAEWLTTLTPELRRKLEDTGLLEVRARAPLALGAYVDFYIANRKGLKPSTLVAMKVNAARLVAFLGCERRLDQVTEGDADRFKEYLIGRGLSDATIRRTYGTARMISKAARRDELIIKDPFCNLPVASRGNPDRQFFVTRPMIDKVLEACLDDGWRLLLLLARFGGLRVPSETELLRWVDVDWTRQRITIHSPKTEGKGKPTRVIPLFPELKGPLQAAFLRHRGAEKVLPPHHCPYSTFKRTVERAGLTPWPRLFQNLRATRATELLDKFPPHIVNSWLGHIESVANSHYRQVTEDHYARGVTDSFTDSAPECTPGMVKHA